MFSTAALSKFLPLHGAFHCLVIVPELLQDKAGLAEHPGLCLIVLGCLRHPVEALQGLLIFADEPEIPGVTRHRATTDVDVVLEVDLEEAVLVEREGLRRTLDLSTEVDLMSLDQVGLVDGILEFLRSSRADLFFGSLGRR